MTESPAMSAVRDARGGLLMTHPFFGVLSLKMELVETPMIPTAGVNTKQLLFNPAFVLSLSKAELKALIAHEVLHMALCHHARQGNREHDRWNLAGDAVINHSLLEDGFTLPKGGFVNKKYDSTWSAEAVYNDLPDDISQAWADAMNSTGDFTEAGPEGSAESGDAEREWMQNVQDAVRVAQSAGKMPAGLKRIVQEAAAPKADWRALLRRFITDQIHPRQSWMRRNKRFADIYLPGNVKEGMGAVVVGVDTSGSITDQVLSRFAAEIRAIMEDCEPARVHVIYCDAAVGRVDTFEHGEELVMEPVGGGGTDFRPVFAEVERQEFKPVCGIYLTDMMGSFPDSEPPYPFLWATYGAGGATGPFGETVVIE
jgi:predicted metal-dependent peptidase